jgi:hypothetical protein
MAAEPVGLLDHNKGFSLVFESHGSIGASSTTANNHKITGDHIMCSKRGGLKGVYRRGGEDRDYKADATPRGGGPHNEKGKQMYVQGLQ